MDRYRVVSKLGEGTYGMVFKCVEKDKHSSKVVAVKRFRESDESDEKLRKTATRELAILRTLQSKENVVQLLEFFRVRGRLHLVFEFMERNLLQVLQTEKNGLKPDIVRWYTSQLCHAVRSCHQSNIVHRGSYTQMYLEYVHLYPDTGSADIKPENLLLNSNHELKLCDFGFAILVQDGQSPLTDYVSTRWYRAPELLVGASYSTAVDIWAIGCIMAEMVSGRPLFAGDTEVEQLTLIQEAMGPLDPALQEVLEKNPRLSKVSLSRNLQNNNNQGTSIQRILNKRMTTAALSFLMGTLQASARKRASIEDCVNDMYVKNSTPAGCPKSRTRIQTPRSTLTTKPVLRSPFTKR